MEETLKPKNPHQNDCSLMSLPVVYQWALTEETPVRQKQKQPQPGIKLWPMILFPAQIPTDCIAHIRSFNIQILNFFTFISVDSVEKIDFKTSLLKQKFLRSYPFS